MASGSGSAGRDDGKGGRQQQIADRVKGYSSDTLDNIHLSAATTKAQQKQIRQQRKRKSRKNSKYRSGNKMNVKAVKLH